MRTEVEQGWWHPNVKDGRVHEHPEHPGGGWSAASHRLCEPVYTLAPAGPEPPFVLDRDDNPHPRLLELALAARRRARLAAGNFAAASYYLGALHACCAATGCDESEIVGWLDAHDRTDLSALAALAGERVGLVAVDVAVRSRRLARLAGGEPLVYRHWQGILDVLCAVLDARPEDVDALVASLDPDPDPEIAPLPGTPVAVRPR